MKKNRPKKPVVLAITQTTPPTSPLPTPALDALLALLLAKDVISGQ